MAGLLNGFATRTEIIRAPYGGAVQAYRFVVQYRI